MACRACRGCANKSDDMIPMVHQKKNKIYRPGICGRKIRKHIAAVNVS
jgi:hypothetical protein